jgi:4-alpha-glucanotransferase
MQKNKKGDSFMTTQKVYPRLSGLLLHPTSLPGPYGIGDLGPEAFHFIDDLKMSGQTLWQVLPLGPIGDTNSPYQSYSSFAGQPLLISPDLLIDDDLLAPEDLEMIPDLPAYRVDYDAVRAYKRPLLEKACTNFHALSDDVALKQEFDAFCKAESEWLHDYCLFMAIKKAHNDEPWYKWESAIRKGNKASKRKWLKMPEVKKEYDYQAFIQFVFFRQWTALKAYANENGISIIGDIPIFTAVNSADVWANPKLFKLDKDGYPTVVAGVPPDYFSATGQLWGNPLYKWPAHKKDRYRWWMSRIRAQLNKYDYVRIDHFRGLDEYWEVPADAETAMEGKWMPGPKADFFHVMREELGDDLPIIAEDLGLISQSVHDLRDQFDLPGMKILQFAFDDIEDNDFLPYNYTKNSICYTGTHDNDTSLGWYYSATEESRDKIRRYLSTDGSQISWDMIRCALASVSRMAIFPIQDVLGHGSDCRMNTPGVANGNWEYRYYKEQFHDGLKEGLREMTKLYGR